MVTGNSRGDSDGSNIIELFKNVLIQEASF